MNKTKSICEICKRHTNQMSINNDYNKILCREHKSQLDKYGETFKWNIRSENEYRVDGDITYIILRNVKMKIVGECIIDTKNLNKVKKYKWRYAQGYCRSNKAGAIHSFIMGKKENMIVDHKNRNRLDCREINLHHATYTENGWNKGTQSNNTSGYVGVSWDKSHGKWEANIKINRKKRFLGYFKTPEEANIERKKAEKKYFGEEVNRKNDIYTIFK